MKIFLLLLFCMKVLVATETRSLLQINNDKDRLKLQSLFQKYLSVESMKKIKNDRFRTFVNYLYYNNLIDNELKDKAVKVFEVKKKYLKKRVIRKLLVKKLELNIPQFKNLPINSFEINKKQWNTYYNDQVIGENYHQLIFAVNKFKQYRKKSELRFSKFLSNFDRYLGELTTLSFINHEQHQIFMSFTSNNLNQLKQKNPFLDPDHFLTLLKHELKKYQKQKKMVFELLDYNYKDIKHDRIPQLKNKIMNQERVQKELQQYGMNYLNQQLKELENLTSDGRKSRKLISNLQRSLILKVVSRSLVKQSFADYLNKFKITNKKKQERTLNIYLNKLVRLKIYEKKPKLLESVLKYQIHNRKLVQGPEIILDDRYKKSLQFRHFMYSFLFVSKQFFSLYMHMPNAFWYKFLEKMPNLKNAGAMGFFMRTFLSIFGKSLKVSSYKNLQTIVHKYADALEYADLVNSQEKIVFAKVFTKFLHKQLKFGGKIDLQESFEKLHDNAGKQIIEHFKAVNYRKVSKHLFNKFNFDLNKVLSRHIDYNITHLPYHKVAKSYIRENYKLKGKSLKKTVLALEKTKLSFFPSMLRDNIIGLVLKTKYGFLWRHKKFMIKRIFSSYQEKYLKLKKVSKIQMYENLSKQFLKLQKIGNENLVISRFKEDSSLTPKQIISVGDFYKKGFTNYYFHDKKEFNEFFSRYLDKFVESHILKFEHKIQFQQLVENMKCFDNHNYNFGLLYKKLKLKKRVNKPTGLQFDKKIKKILHPFHYNKEKHLNSLLAKFKLKTMKFFDKDQIKFQKSVSKAMYDKSPNEYVFDARKKMLKKTMYKMMAKLTDNKKVFQKNIRKDLRKKDIQNILSLNGNKNLVKMFFKSQAFSGSHQLKHVKETIGALQEINKIQNKEIRKILFKQFLLKQNKKLEYDYHKKLYPKDIYSKSFTRDQLNAIYKYKYDVQTAHKMLKFIKENKDPLSLVKMSNIELPEMNSYVQKVKFANLFKVVIKKLYYQKVLKKVFGKKFSQEINMLKFYYSKKEKLKKVERLFNNQILRLFSNESQYKQDLDQSVNVFKKVILSPMFGPSERKSYSDGLLEFYSEILQNKQNWKVRDEGDFGKIKILMEIPDEGVKEKEIPDEQPEDVPEEKPEKPKEFLIICCLCADCNDQEEILENENLQFLRQADQVINIHPSFKINLFLQKQGKIIKQSEMESEINQNIMDQKQAVEEAKKKLDQDQVEQVAIDQNLTENEARQQIIEENIDQIMDQGILEKDIQKIKQQKKQKIDNDQATNNDQPVEDNISDNYGLVSQDEINELKQQSKKKPTQVDIQGFYPVEDFIPDQLDYTQPDNELQNQVKNAPKIDDKNFEQNAFNINIDTESDMNQNLNNDILRQAKSIKLNNHVVTQNISLANINDDNSQIDQKQLVNEFQSLNDSLKNINKSNQKQQKADNLDLNSLLSQQTKNVQKKVYVENVPQNLDVPDLDQIYKPVTFKIIKKSLI